MSPLGVVADGVTSPHPETESVRILCKCQLNLNIPDPLGDGTVLLHLLRKLLLDAESLKSGHYLK